MMENLRKKYRLVIPEKMLKWLNTEILNSNGLVSNQWNIDIPKEWLEEIPQEPKVLTADESFGEDYGRLPDEFPKEYNNYYKQGFKKGKEIGRLERNLELDPLFDAVKSYRDDYQAYEKLVINVLRNLKPLNEVNP